MRLFDFLAVLSPEVSPQRAKIHLATSNEVENPLDRYIAGEFNSWQRRQSRKNFERELVVSLISYGGTNRWLFAGVHHVRGHETLDAEDRYPVRYLLQEDQACQQMNGRVVARFSRPGRQAYLNAESWADQIHLEEVLSKAVSIAEFPGFRFVHLSKEELDRIVRQGAESWKAALSSVAGIYLISHPPSGKLYVGSAHGEGGIWQRWCHYSTSGHGENVELKKLLEAESALAAQLRFSILEIADLHTSREEVLARESHWKRVLLTRLHGLNAN